MIALAVLAVVALIGFGVWGASLPKRSWQEEMFQPQPEPYDPQGEPGNFWGPKPGTRGTIPRGR